MICQILTWFLRGHFDLNVTVLVEGVMAFLRHWIEAEPKGFGRDHIAYRTDQMAIGRELAAWI